MAIKKILADRDYVIEAAKETIYAPQELTDEQKARARANIGAAAAERVLAEIVINEVDGQYLLASNTFKTIDGYHCRYTDPIPVAAGDRFSLIAYNIAWTDGANIVFLDANENAVSAESFWKEGGEQAGSMCKLITVPSGVAFVRFAAMGGGLLADLTEIMKLRFEVLHMPRADEERTLIVNEKTGGYYEAENVWHSRDDMCAKRTDPIPVVTGDTFYFTGGGSDISKAIWYGEDGMILSTISGTGSQQALTPPDGAVLVRFISNAYSTMISDVVLSVTWQTNDRILEYLQGMNYLWKKKYVACGDSFTAGDFAEKTEETWDEETQEYKTYCWHIATRNHMTLVNEAVSGTTMYNNGADNAFSVTRYTEIPADADYITLCFGLNETSATIGTLEDTTNETVMGAWNVVLEHLITNHPYAKIGIIIPDAWCSAAMREALIDVAEYWGIPYLDLTGDPKVPLLIGGRIAGPTLSATAVSLRTAAFAISSEDMHPNAKGHAYRSTIIENFLRSL